MANKYWRPVVSLPAVHFIAATMQDVISENYDLPLPFNCPALVRVERIISFQNLNYEFWLFSSAVNMVGTLATDRFIACWQFPVLVPGPPASPGYLVGMSNFYRFYTEGFATPYNDEDCAQGLVTNASLHVRLVVRSVAGKMAFGAGGDLQVAFLVTPQGEYA